MLSRLTALNTEADVKRLKLKPPDDAGSYWAGVSFSALLDAVRTRAGKRSWVLEKWVIDLSRNGADMVASATLTYQDYTWKNGHVYTPSIGLAASNNRRRALRFYVGVVPVGTDSALVLDVIHPRHRRLTHNFDVTGVVEDVFTIWSTKVTTVVPEAVALLQNRRLTLSEADRIMMAAGRANLMPSSRIVRAHDAWLKGGDRSAYGLAVAFGHVSAANTPVKHMDRLYGFFNLLTGQEAVAAVG